MPAIRWSATSAGSATAISRPPVNASASRQALPARLPWRNGGASSSPARMLPISSIPEPLSRVAPVVMFFFAAEQEAVQLASDAARTTCQAPAVLGACRDLARALFLALSGQPKPQILAGGSSTATPQAARSSSTPSPRAGEGTRRTTPRPMRSPSRSRRSPRPATSATPCSTRPIRAAIRTSRRRRAANSPAPHYGAAAIPAPWRALPSAAHADRDLRRPASAALSARDRRVGLGYAVSPQRPAGASQKVLGNGLGNG